MYWLIAVLVLLIVYPYAVYPAVLYIRARRQRDFRSRGEDFEPAVSIVIPFHREGTPLGDKVDQIRALDYPDEKIEIVFASDGAGITALDETIERGGLRLQLASLPQRRGKAMALNAAVGIATHEVLIFFDFRQHYDAGILRALVAPLADPAIAGVAGDIVYEDFAGSDFYWKLESLIRAYESRCRSTINVSGANYSLRRSCYETLPEGIILDDLYLPLAVAAKGGRILYSAEAVAYDPDYQRDATAEREKKRRTLAGNFQILFEYPRFLIPARNQAWFEYYSHKLSRLFVPLWLALLLLTCLWFSQESIWILFLLLAQMVVYGLFLSSSHLPEGIRQYWPIRIPLLFLRLNGYVVAGLSAYLRDRHRHLW